MFWAVISLSIRTYTVLANPRYTASPLSSCPTHDAIRTPISRVGQNPIHAVYTVFFGREITEYTVIYGVYIQFWPILPISLPVTSQQPPCHLTLHRCFCWNTTHLKILCVANQLNRQIYLYNMYKYIFALSSFYLPSAARIPRALPFAAYLLL